MALQGQRGVRRPLPLRVLFRLARRLPLSTRRRLRSLWTRAVPPPTPVPSIAQRLRSYSAAQQPGLLSFVTTVWNTDPAFVDALAKSVFDQEGGTAFEWFILDNGTERSDTRASLAEIARHPSVRFARVEANLGIIGGMRYCLERASGQYILPLDSDDLLSLDCVTILTTLIVENDYPALLYSDEDKLWDDVRCMPYYKPDWDPVLFLHSCYIAHLCAIDRQKALDCGAYTDPVVEGSHDWDTFTRFYLAGHTPVHVPEVVYSWRMHAQSTSSNIGSKPVVYESQKAVVGRFLSGIERGERYRVIKSPLFAGSPDWWIRRAHFDAPPMTTLLLTNDPKAWKADVKINDYPDHRVIAVPLSGGLAAIAAALDELQGLVHLLWDQVSVRQAEWAWEAVTLLELFPDAVMVGGRIFNQRNMVADAGSYFGFGRGCDPPDRGRPPEDPGYFAAAWKQHSTSAVSSQHAVIRVEFLAETLRELMTRGEASIAYLGAWAGAAAQIKGKRVIYTPFIEGKAAGDWDARVTDKERAAFILAHADLLPETRFFSRHLSFKPSAPYCMATPQERAEHQERLRSWAKAQTAKPKTITSAQGG
jgi:glycosyltransferase involved in cell wall biosynthesis